MTLLSVTARLLAGLSRKAATLGAAPDPCHEAVGHAPGDQGPQGLSGSPTLMPQGCEPAPVCPSAAGHLRSPLDWTVCPVAHGGK